MNSIFKILFLTTFSILVFAASDAFAAPTEEQMANLDKYLERSIIGIRGEDVTIKSSSNLKTGLRWDRAYVSSQGFPNFIYFSAYDSDDKFHKDEKAGALWGLNYVSEKGYYTASSGILFVKANINGRICQPIRVQMEDVKVWASSWNAIEGALDRLTYVVQMPIVDSNCNIIEHERQEVSRARIFTVWEASVLAEELKARFNRIYSELLSVTGEWRDEVEWHKREAKKSNPRTAFSKEDADAEYERWDSRQFKQWKVEQSFATANTIMLTGGTIFDVVIKKQKPLEMADEVKVEVLSRMRNATDSWISKAISDAKERIEILKKFRK